MCCYYSRPKCLMHGYGISSRLPEVNLVLVTPIDSWANRRGRSRPHFWPINDTYSCTVSSYVPTWLINDIYSYPVSSYQSGYADAHQSPRRKINSFPRTARGVGHQSPANPPSLRPGNVKSLHRGLGTQNIPDQIKVRKIKHYSYHEFLLWVRLF